MLSTVFRPWRTTQTWWSLCHLCLDLVIATIGFTFVVTMASTAGSLIVLFPAAIVVAWLGMLGTHAYAVAERSRFAALLGTTLHDPNPKAQGRNWWYRFIWRFRTASRWKELGYALLHLPLAVLTTTTATTLWAGGVVLLLLPLIVGQFASGAAEFGLFEIGSGPGVGLLSVLGLVVVGIVAPWATTWLAELDRAVGRLLLGRSERVEFEERVSELQTSRAAAVDSAEAERRRIERDLHDGAQQRLIAVAMDLGVARQAMETDPDRARELVSEAHDEVKAALKELRDLVRGIHPVILEDRGLDAALSAVVARAGVPVELRVDVAPRPSPSVESAAYFIVSEALTNVARHSQATRATVEIVRRRDRLTIVVSDDGVGGASSASGGTGLRGLEERVAALDGWMQVVSPVGGPTTVLVEVPCGS
ncbi:sensor histidine kinase [Dermatobacter hominis]|uniref:sensor histidine kinase n=1 Tax=Dermatobacter hominis TaxID=2884263 RepID=UPI001D119889|nr:sensor histidine kinase [Dermatobacter hominis]UDY36458.1 sensor histidine kinase [Dermatobacter hominis]